MRRLINTLLLIFMSMPLGAQMIEPQSDRKTPPMELVGGETRFDMQNNHIFVEADERGAATLHIGGHSITANSMEFDRSQEILDATGEVKLWYEGTILIGDRLRFNVPERAGTMHEVQQSEIADNIFFTGKRLDYRELSSEEIRSATPSVPQREYELHDGIITSNDKPYPYYYLDYDRLVIQPNTRFWAYNMYFATQKMPILYLPFYSRSLKKRRTFTYFFDAAYYSKLGAVAFNRVRYRYSDDINFDVYGDYYTDLGIGKGARTKFDFQGEYGPEGYLYGYHLDQDGPDNDRIFEDDDRYHIAGEYRQDLPYDTHVAIRGHKLSDSEYRWDFRKPERVRQIDVEDTEMDTVSYANVTKRWRDQTLRITASQRFDPFYYNGLPFIEREPQIHFEQYPWNLFNTGVFGNMQFDYGRYRRESGVTFPLDKDNLFDQTDYYDDIERFDSELKLTYPVNFPFGLHVKPWSGFRATHYGDPSRTQDDPTQAGHQLQTYDFDSESRLMFEGGMDISTRSVSMYDSFLNRYEKMRTVFEPILKYSYYHPSTDLEEITEGTDIRFPYIDSVDEYRYQMHRLSALLNTRIQGKDEVEVTSDFASLTAGLSYDYFPDENLRFENFTYYDDTSEQNDYRFTDLVEDFQINPFPWLNLGNTLRYDVDDSEIRSSYSYANFTPTQRLRIGTGYYTFKFPFTDNSTQEDITYRMVYDVNPKWSVYYLLRYDLDRSVFRSNRVGLMRDMYDFYAMFEFEHEDHPTLGDEYSVHFSIRFWGLGGRQGRPAPVDVRQ